MNFAFRLTVSALVTTFSRAFAQAFAALAFAFDEALTPALESACSTYTRARTLRQLMHTASRSDSHARDKAEGQRRRQTRFVPVTKEPCPGTYPPWELEPAEFVREGAGWRKCSDPDELWRVLATRERELRTYRTPLKRHGVETTMQRTAPYVYSIITVMDSPWACAWTRCMLASGRDPRPQLATIRNRTTQAVIDRLAGEREVHAFATHTDASVLHTDYIVTRYADGRRLGRAGLRLGGPHLVALQRHIWAGATLSPRARERFESSVRVFRARYGPDAVPLDVELAWRHDKHADEVIGQELTQFREEFAASVPQRERDNIAAELAALDKARAKLVGDLSQTTPETQTPSIK